MRPLPTRGASAADALEAFPPPGWEPGASELLEHAQRLAAVVTRATPRNLRGELAALEADFRRGAEREPRFDYEPLAAGDLEPTLRRAAELLRRQDHDLARVYAERAEELALELQLCAIVGSPSFRGLARRRFAVTREALDAADALAARWLEGGPDAPLSPGAARPDEEARVVSDDPTDPRSLTSRLSAEIGARRWPIRVIPTDRMAALAATGDGVILVARGRSLTVRDVERTVLHELDGHAAPREQAARLKLGVFRFGTARGADDQEGRALWLEERAGHLDGRRRRELALRHRACRGLEDGASFVETARSMVAEGAPLDVALRIGARAYRGGGLGRELVYVPSYLAVKERLEREPSVDRVLASGRVALDAAACLAPWATVGRGDVGAR